MELRQAYLAMIRKFPGGWDAMSAALGMTRAAFENRVYETKGQAVCTETALQMQRFSKSEHFAEAIAEISGGVFVKMPLQPDMGREELLEKFVELYAELGELSGKFKTSVEDGEIDPKERAALSEIGLHIHMTLEQLLSIGFSVYCRPGKD